MKKKQILSSLMVSGVLLSNVVQVSAATQSLTPITETSTNSLVQNSKSNLDIASAEPNLATPTLEGQSPVSSDSVVVNSYDELKTALSSNNGVTNITLGSDITISSGIEINSSKASVTIDGNGHKLTEATLLNGAHGTIYISNNVTKEVSLKNISVAGKDFYGPIGVDDTVSGVMLNYENVTYNGPQLVHNVHGFAKFSGTNTIHIMSGGNGSDPAQEMMEGLGVEIDGSLNVTHDSVGNAVFWFGAGNGLGASTHPYFKVNDNANVSFNISSDSLFYVDNSSSAPLDMTIGPNSNFEVNTNRELFRLGTPGKVDLLDGSSTKISRSGGGLLSAPTIPLSNSSLTVKENASLEINNSVAVPIFSSGLSNSSLNFENAKKVDLHVPSSSSIMSSTLSNTTLDIKTNTLQSWHHSDGETPSYQNTSPLEANISFGLLGAINLNSSNQPDILNKWDVKATNHLVLNGEAISNNLPVISASDKVLKVGDTFNELDGVTASDTEDGDLTGSVTVKSNNVDTSKAGTYHVIYSVTDSDGNTTEKTITVTVTSDSAPTIGASDKTLNVGDTFNELDGVTASDAEDGDLTGSVTVKSNDVDTSKAGTYHVTYSVTDSDGNTTEKTITVTVNSVNTSGTITPNTYDLSGTNHSVTGTYTGDVKSVRVEINGNLQGVGGTVSNGNFSYYVGGKVSKVTDKVVVIGYDATGNELDRENVTIINSNSYGRLTPNIYDLSGTNHSVTGTYTGDVKSIKLKINGEFQPVGGTVSNGNFSYYVGPNKITKTTDEVIVIGYDATGKELDQEKVTLKTKETSGTVTPNEYDLSGTNHSVTGAYTGDVKSIKLKINGEFQPVGGTVSNGNFSYYVGPNKITKTTDEVVVIGYDATGKELDQEKVTLKAKETSGTVIPSEYDLSGLHSVTGAYTGDVKTIKIKINGEYQPAGGTVSNGNFSYYVGPNKITKTTDEVVVVGYDATGKELDQEKVTLKAKETSGTVIPSEYNLTGAHLVTGAYTGDVSSVKIEINDVLQPAGGIVDNNEFSYYVGPNKITKVTDQVFVHSYDRSGKELDKKQVTIKAE